MHQSYQKIDQESYRLKDQEKSLVVTKEKGSFMLAAQIGLPGRYIS